MWLTLLFKELREQRRTSKLLIFLAVFLITGLLSPVLAKYTPQLLGAIPDLPIDFASLIPEPTVKDAVVQYLKNASQFGTFLAVVLTMGVMAQEKERGTVAMLLTKPVRRSAVVLAKWLAGMLVLLASLVVALLACEAYTTVLFEFLPLAAFLKLNALLLLFLAVYFSMALLASTLARTQSMAAAGAFGGLALLLLLSSLPRLDRFMPGQLLTWGSTALIGKEATAWPAVIVSLALIAGCLLVACLFFEREEV